MSQRHILSSKFFSLATPIPYNCYAEHFQLKDIASEYNSVIYFPSPKHEIKGVDLRSGKLLASFKSLVSPQTLCVGFGYAVWFVQL